MWSTARRLLLTGVLVAGFAVPASPVLAQQPPDLAKTPRLTTEPPASLRGEPAATPTPTPEATPVRSDTDEELPNTGSDAQTLALAGLSLLLLGASLRLQVSLRDGRR